MYTSSSNLLLLCLYSSSNGPPPGSKTGLRLGPGLGLGILAVVIIGILFEACDLEVKYSPRQYEDTEQSF